MSCLISVMTPGPGPCVSNFRPGDEQLRALIEKYAPRAGLNAREVLDSDYAQYKGTITVRLQPLDVAPCAGCSLIAARAWTATGAPTVQQRIRGAQVRGHSGAASTGVQCLARYA